MRITLFILCCIFVSTLAWLPPERCRQGKSRRASTPVLKKTPQKQVTPKQIAKSQQQNTELSYKNFTMRSVPTKATCDTYKVDLFAAFNCKFHTYDPKGIASTTCSKSSCKLARTVSKVDTYTAEEGYNWGVKVTGSVSVIPEVFEIGGEAETGGTYSCSYEQGKTVSDTVECTGANENGQLELYSVQTDMICDFGTIKLVQDLRDYTYGDVADNTFTESDIKQIKDYAAAFFVCRVPTSIMIDTDKISTRLYTKIVTAFPKFNPYTDILILESDFVMATYYKQTEFLYEFKKIIPFTTEKGDSVYQYACIFTPS